jgi:hypothetical protein
MGSVGVNVSCPRCDGPVRPPDLMHSEWRCDRCGPVVPLRVPPHVNAAVVAAVVERLSGSGVPLWCPWPLPLGWTVTGVAWASDERSGARASGLAATGPSPLTGGPADLLLVAEAPGVGLASRLAGLLGPDPGPALAEAMASHPPHAKVRAGRHPVPLWSVPSAQDRSAYAGEAHAMWLVAVAWPETAGYQLSDDLVLRDLTEWLPGELVYGAPSARLSSGTGARNE